MSTDIGYVLLIGLVTAFWTNLFTRSPASPKWLQQLRKYGKPWSCPICMSFWLGLVFSLMQAGLVASTMTTPVPADHVAVIVQGLISLLLLTSAVAMVSIVILAVLDKLEILTLK